MSDQTIEPPEAPLPAASIAKPDIKTTIVEWVQFIRSMLLNGIVIAALLAVIVFAAKDLWREQVIIEKFGLPETLTNRGLSGAVTANRVWDAMTDIQIAAGTKKATRTLLAESRQLDVVEPGTGLSLKSATQMFRDLFGVEQTRIGGDIICGTDACDWNDLNVRLRVFAGGQMYIIDSGPTGTRDPGQVFHELAIEALLIVDPYIVAAFKYGSGDAGTRAEAVNLATRMVDSGHPQSAWAANLIGNSNAENNLHRAAIKWFERALTLASHYDEDDFALPHFGRGNSHMALGEHDLAMRAFEVAISMDDDFPQPIYGKGQVFIQLEEFDKAMPLFQRAVDIDPSDAAHWTALGSTVDKLEGAEPALPHLQRAHRLDDGDVLVLSALGKVLVDLERYDEAQDYLEQVIEIDPTVVVARLALGRALLGQGKNGAAVRQLRMAANLDKDSALAWDSLAAGLVVTGDVAGAAEASGKAQELDPELETEVGIVIFANLMNGANFVGRIGGRN